LFNLAIIAIWGCFIFPPHSSAEELITVDKALKQLFPKADSFNKKVFSLSAQQIHQIEETAKLTFNGTHSERITVYVTKEKDKIVGYAFEDTVIGKWGPIHYLLALNPEGTILQIIILDYQEIRGKPIAKKRFLRQYQNKGIDDELQLRKDIDGISGATISSRSLTDGARKIVRVYHLMRSDSTLFQ